MLRGFIIFVSESKAKTKWNAVRQLKEKNIVVSDPKRYPEYTPDYFAAFFSDPGGLQLEISNYRLERRQHHDKRQDIEPKHHGPRDRATGWVNHWCFLLWFQVYGQAQATIKRGVLV